MRVGANGGAPAAAHLDHRARSASGGLALAAFGLVDGLTATLVCLAMETPDGYRGRISSA
jgi:hypothetical protein